MNLRMLN